MIQMQGKNINQNHIWVVIRKCEKDNLVSVILNIKQS